MDISFWGAPKVDFKKVGDDLVLMEETGWGLMILFGDAKLWLMRQLLQKSIKAWIGDDTVDVKNPIDMVDISHF